MWLLKVNDIFDGNGYDPHGNGYGDGDGGSGDGDSCYIGNGGGYGGGDDTGYGDGDRAGTGDGNGDSYCDDYDRAGPEPDHLLLLAALQGDIMT